MMLLLLLLLLLLSSQRIHQFEVMISRKAEGRQGKAFVGHMTEEKSVELASKLASESFLFVVRPVVVLLPLLCTALESWPVKASQVWHMHVLGSLYRLLACLLFKPGQFPASAATACKWWLDKDDNDVM
jgi:hypothetical protein